MILSKRLQTLVFFVPSSAKYIADIGADHGYVSLELLKRNSNIKIWATDNKQGPFKRLQNTLKDHKNALVKLTDGLNDLPLDVDTILISGMGGENIYSILKNGENHFPHIDNFILSPHGEEELIRRYLYEKGYVIKDETMLKEGPSYYVIFLFQKGNDALSDLDAKFGPLLRKKKDKVFIEYLEEEKQRVKRLLEIKNINSTKKQELLNYYKELDAA